MKKTCTYILLIFLLLTSVAEAAVERRKDQFGKDFGYYVYPIAGEIPGIGSALGVGATVLNMGGKDTDFTGYYVRGDFDATGAALLDYHLIPKRLILDFGYNDYLVGPTVYPRGIDSDPDEVIYPKAEGRYLLAQLTLTFDERRYEMFVRGISGEERLHEVLDSEGRAFQGVDTSWNSYDSISLGGSLDLTDDRLDPRKGIRFEFSARLPEQHSNNESEYFVTDFNLTKYIPMRRWDTLVFNLFHSRAIVTEKGLTDFDTLQQQEGLNCDQYAPGSQRDACLRTEEHHINNIIANNRYGTASGLGGTQRMRAYDSFRYYAARALFYGVEYRWNLTDEYTPFDIFIAKGIRTGIQLAAFWERGMVAEHSDELLDDGRNSLGVGFRVILSGVVIRFDYATGDEGEQGLLFITYPWSMFSVDSPG